MIFQLFISYSDDGKKKEYHITKFKNVCYFSSTPVENIVSRPCPSSSIRSAVPQSLFLYWEYDLTRQLPQQAILIMQVASIDSNSRHQSP